MYEHKVNSISTKLKDILMGAGFKSGSVKKKKNRLSTKFRRQNNKPWYTEDCRRKRKELLDLKYNTNMNCVNDRELRVKDVSKEYNKLLHKSYYKYKRDLNKRLRNLRSSSPKDYWNIINNSKGNSDGNVKLNMESFVNHFKQ